MSCGLNERTIDNPRKSGLVKSLKEFLFKGAKRVGRVLGSLIYPDGLEDVIRKEQEKWYKRITEQRAREEATEGATKDWWGNKKDGVKR